MPLCSLLFPQPFQKNPAPFARQPILIQRRGQRWEAKRGPWHFGWAILIGQDQKISCRNIMMLGQMFFEMHKLEKRIGNSLDSKIVWLKHIDDLVKEYGAPG